MERSPLNAKILIVNLLALLLCACANEPKYYWGSYEDQVYAEYNFPERSNPEQLIQNLEEEVQNANGHNKPLPPGFYAYLGYQYLRAEKSGEARTCFETERRNYPESATLMDRYLKKLR